METRKIILGWIMTNISWSATKLFLKKAWIWLKTYWYFPLLAAYTVVLRLLFRRNDEATRKVLAASKESYESQIKSINEAHAKEIARRDQALQNYEAIISALEKEYNLKREELDEEKKKKIKEYIEKFEEDPEELAKIIEERFGIRYTPNEENE